MVHKNLCSSQTSTPTRGSLSSESWVVVLVPSFSGLSRMGLVAVKKSSSPLRRVVSAYALSARQFGHFRNIPSGARYQALTQVSQPIMFLQHRAKMTGGDGRWAADGTTEGFCQHAMEPSRDFHIYVYSEDVVDIFVDVFDHVTDVTQLWQYFFLLGAQARDLLV